MKGSSAALIGGIVIGVAAGLLFFYEGRGIAYSLTLFYLLPIIGLAAVVIGSIIYLIKHNAIVLTLGLMCIFAVVVQLVTLAICGIFID